jgi:dTDP-4-dehydrorhamnose 3,5-epimerase-like enzyme
MTLETIKQDLARFSGAARLVPFKVHTDERGSLLPIEFDHLPFTPRRVFTVASMPKGTVRGGHGHRGGQQLLICLHGQIEATVRTGDEEAHTLLLPGGPGLLFGPGVWCRQTYLIENSVLLVFASEPFDPESKIEAWK